MKKIAYFIILAMCISLFGCTSNERKTSIKPFKREEPPLIDLNDSTDNKDDACCYTEENLTEDEKNNTAFMAIIENSKDARPQSGLSEADLVFETMAEGGIPRFIALFHKNSPKQIGPIRSVRPYFISIAKEFNVPFAHCGGSEEALSIIKSTSSINNINEISNGEYFYRDNSRKAPHNLYTTANQIRKYISTKNIKTDLKCNFNFDNKFWERENMDKATTIELGVNKSYSTSYKYVNGRYEKYMDGVKVIDKNNNLPVTFSNVVIQNTDIKLQSDNTHLDINLIGKGTGFVFSSGKVKRVTWQRNSENEQTELFTEDGNKVCFSKGTTIWHIIDNSVTSKYN
ncbi:DUF3048 domain-containing protein [Clostridium manihotivorum]|uniref:DUF3048 domain-containing protein n=1 Tax=Clostridium manihotivorum TaxID=2320868 RepID=A0A410DNU1_9CLOT|nr:DUF3048 domain-containing protein [Clostridium manihotivorum]QAA30697.1 DUF3048 domain-containing protein [Clostridium manihotivorum]